MEKPILNPCVRIQSPYYYSKSHTYSHALGECTQALEFKNSYLSSRKNQIDYTFMSKGLKKLKSIKLLKLDFQHITQFNVLEFANMTMKNFSNLKTLKISIHIVKSINIQTCQAFTQTLKYLHEIRELYLSLSTYQQGFDMVSSHLIKEISRMLELEVLSLKFGGTLISFDSLEYFFNPIYTLNKLKTFGLELVQFEVSELVESSIFSKCFEHNAITDFAFEISRMDTINDSILSVYGQIISFLKNLKKINLRFQTVFILDDVSEASYIRIFEVLAQKKNLEHIEIVFGAYDFELSKSIDKLYSLIKNSALCLKVLRLDCNANIESSQLTELIQILHNLFLEELSLRFLDFREYHLEKLFSNSSLNNIKILKLSACLETDFSINLDSCKMFLSKITEFSLTITKILVDESNIWRFIEIFTYLDSIRIFSLYLDNSKFTELQFIRLFEIIKSFNFIESFSLSFTECDVEYKIIKELCGSIKNLKTLKLIYFEFDFKLDFYMLDFLRMLEELPVLSKVFLPMTKFMKEKSQIILLKNFLAKNKSIQVFEIEKKCVNEYNISWY